MTENEIKKSIEAVVDTILAQPSEEIKKEGENVEKAMPTSLPANGGKDEIRSGSPHSEKQEMMSDKKKEEAKKAEDADEEDEEEKKKKEKEKMKKAEDEEDDEEDKEKEEKSYKAKKAMKKSLEALSEHLDAEELGLIEAWREELATQETVAKSEQAKEIKTAESEDLKKSLAKALEDAVAPLKKAIEDKDSAIKNLTDKVEKMASQPAYDRRSISTLEPLEKSGAATQEITKSQIVDKMLELQLAGKGVTSHHIAEFEATRNISNQHVKELVFKQFKLS